MRGVTERAIRTEGLGKDYGSTVALADLDLEVAPGEVIGYLGPNGAGKTTTLRLLLGLIRPTAGRAEIFGVDCHADPVEAHRRVAYVPGEANLWPTLTGAETLHLLGQVFGRVDEAYKAELIDRFHLDTDKKVRAYSKGNRQKVALVAALASDVELLLLDEPTSGLDPLMEDVFRQVIREERHQGRTVLLSSHILAEVEALCDRVTIIRDGRAVETGTLAELRHLTRVSIQAELARPATGLADLPGVHGLDARDHSVRFDVDNEALDAALRQLAGAGVRSLVSQPPTLEELFLRHYDRAGGEGARAAEVTR